jgi:hypothetical protein
LNPHYSSQCQHFHPRVHILLASHAPLGVVIRRGPSKHVATMLWHRRHDEFQLGQWMKGRIYERRSDLSTLTVKELSTDETVVLEHVEWTRENRNAIKSRNDRPSEAQKTNTGYFGMTLASLRPSKSL